MPTESGLSGPHLSAAFLCEKVLHERDGVPSFIRIVERFTVPTAPKLPPGVQLPAGLQIGQPTIQIFLVIGIKAGSMGTGKYNMRAKIYKPDGTETQTNPFSVFLNGTDDNGALVVSPLVIVGPDEGLFWIDVYFEESLLTRIPMRVLHQSGNQTQLR
jgi:hypothetical protein